MSTRTSRKGENVQKLALVRPAGVAKVWHALDHSPTRFALQRQEPWARDDSDVIPKKAQTTAPLGLFHDQAFSGVYM